MERAKVCDKNKKVLERLKNPINLLKKQLGMTSLVLMLGLRIFKKPQGRIGV